MSDLREIVLDTETTGLDPVYGDRIVEIGCVELINHLPTGRTYHQYINPRMAMPREAQAIHGISDADLADKPVFEDIADAFIEFIADSTLVIHNASFDMKFLNAELAKARRDPLKMSRSLDTVAMARSKFPGAQANLDALCRRFGIDNSRRTKHGALLDSEILAEVYLELIGGRQSMLGLSAAGSDTGGGRLSGTDRPARTRPSARPALMTEDERTAHTAFIATLESGGRWGS